VEIAREVRHLLKLSSAPSRGTKGGRWLKTTGRHLLVEYRGCDTRILNDKDRIEDLMRSAAEKARATVVGSVFRTFQPQGVSGVVVIEESHLSIHTWPEYGYAAVDFYTCGDCLPDLAHREIRDGLQAEEAEVMSIDRGQDTPGSSIRVVGHRHEANREPALAGP
jgi:S-adenosylmethionine decarboxylase proenzyme